MHTWILLGLLRFNYTLYETNLEVAKWKLNIWPINRLLQQHRKEGRILESFLRVLWDMSSQDGFMEVQLDGRESGWTPGVGDGQGGLACCDAWGHKESDTTERLHLHAYTKLMGINSKHRILKWSLTLVPFLIKICILHMIHIPLFSPLYGHSEGGDSTYKLYPDHLMILFCNASEGFKLMNILNHEKNKRNNCNGNMDYRMYLRRSKQIN